jgi:hypothetical protein
MQEKSLASMKGQALIKHRVDPWGVVDGTNPTGAIHILDDLARGNRIACLVLEDGWEVHVLQRGLVKGDWLPIVRLQARLRVKKLPRLERRNQNMLRGRLNRGVARSTIVTGGEGSVRGLSSQRVFAGGIRARTRACGIVGFEALDRVRQL